MTQLILLRGINVGGNNIIRMKDLYKQLRDVGFSNIKTYIQSGNIVANLPVGNLDNAKSRFDAVLKTFSSNDIQTLFISKEQMLQIIYEAPEKFGNPMNNRKYDVLFLLDTYKPEWDEDIKLKCVNPETDTFDTGTFAHYFSRDASLLTQSKLPKLASLKPYKHMTIRNWNTTMKLVEMMEG